MSSETEPLNLRDEILLCGRDPCYFITKYVKIRHPVRGIIPFKLFDYQTELIHDYVNYRFNVILKGRQIGISECTAAFATWLMLFHREKSILVIASKVETAKNIIKKIATSLKYLPKWLMLSPVKFDNRLSIELENGSWAKAIASAGDAGRSEAVSFLVVDEAAFVPKFDVLWTGLRPTVSTGGRVSILSTPNGVGNKFHEIYSEAETGRGDPAIQFKPHKFMWWVHPERISDLSDDPDRPGFKTSSWFRQEVSSANLTTRQIAQELECNFNSSGDTVIPQESIDHMLEGTHDPVEIGHDDRQMFEWYPPVKGHRYLISADVARGDGKDYSTFHVWDIEHMTQCVEYQGKIPPDEFAKLLVSTGRRYETAVLVIENNSIGQACIEHVKILAYENLYYSRKNDIKPGIAVNAQWGTTRDDVIAGFGMNAKTRPLLIAKFEEYVRNRDVKISSSRFCNELRTFIWNNHRAEAARGYNDDLVMAAAIGIWVRDTFFASSVATNEMSKKMINAITSTKNVHTQIPGASKDPRFVRVSMSPSQHQPLGIMGGSDYTIRLPRGQSINLGWLFDRRKR